MTQQELLRIYSMYLPYGTKVLDAKFPRIQSLTAINESGTIYTIESNDWKNLERYKLVLRPLSDLTKSIHHDGSIITPIDISNNYLDKQRKMIISEFENMAKHNYFDGYLPFNVCERLIEWKFDIFGLIEKGLAVNKNEMK